MTTTQLHRIDCVVIGAGVVGLAVARAVAMTGREVIVIERAHTIGTGASSRNSEVIHAGLYYPSRSLKARLCVEGKAALYRYCAERGVAHRRLGKIIVAVTEQEIAALQRYEAQARANGVLDLSWLSAAEVRELEPEVTAVRGLLSPSTGIIDSHELMLALQGDLEALGGLIAFDTQVKSIAADGTGWRLSCGEGDDADLHSAAVINAAGLQAPALAANTRGLPDAAVPRAYFAKGHYYSLSGVAPFRRLVYPLATEGGLGVHVTLDMAGAVRFGPDVRWVDSLDYAFDDSQRANFVRAIKRYYPGLDEASLLPAYTGIRSKITGPGAPAGDFVIQGPADHGLPGLVNLFGIESPGLTASLAIGDRVAAILGC
jgi:L-2-hydroxyglutarate oxidase LhgO